MIAIANRCTEVESGARNVDNILTNTLLPDISRRLLASMVDGKKLTSLQIGVDETGSFIYLEDAKTKSAELPA